MPRGVRRVSNHLPTNLRFSMLTDKIGGPVHPIHGRCWVWLGATHVRQGRATVKINGKQMAAAKYAWFLKHGSYSEQHVLHKCDNVLCVNPDHLFEGTQAENVSDMMAKGREKVRGEDNGRVKLTDEQVREIAARYVARSPINGSIALAKEYRVARCTIERIVTGTTRSTAL